jgi:hypothetical protein
MNFDTGDLLSLLFYLLLLTGAITAVAGAFRSPKWYWAAAAVMYFVSFLGSWSIGLYLLCSVFVLSALALGHSLGKIKGLGHSVAVVVAGVAVWAVAIYNIDDAGLFFPFHLMF